MYLSFHSSKIRVDVKVKVCYRAIIIFYSTLVSTKTPFTHALFNFSERLFYNSVNINSIEIIFIDVTKSDKS